MARDRISRRGPVHWRARAQCPPARLLLVLRLLSALWIGLLAVSPVAAQSLSFGAAGSGPLEIEANDGIEWLRSEQRYVASGNALARQGGVSVSADVLAAAYRVRPDGSNEIYRITADGNVVIRSEREVATGARAVYDLDKGTIILTGDTVRLVTNEDRIIADQSLEYDIEAQRAIARGNALALRDDRRLRADVLTAYFKDAPQGGGESASLDRIEAVGNVVIVTSEDVVRAESGVYQLDAGLARLDGSVRITRGDNQLSGEVAEVNLNTGVSRLLGGASDSRVHGLIVPNEVAGERKPVADQ